MARYKTYSISHGDTIQSIAQHEMGSVASWEDIVDYNNLVYPYIVDTVDEKMENVEGLVTIGDTLVIPIEVSLLDTNMDAVNQRDKDLIMGLALGRDLSMTYDEDTHANKGLFGESMNMIHTNQGDIKTVQGVENIKQAVNNRLLTPKGSLLLHPNYGSDIHRLLGRRANYDTMIMIEDEIVKTIQTDNRIESVEVVNSTIETEIYRGLFIVNLYAVETYFEVVVESDENGSFAIF